MIFSKNDIIDSRCQWLINRIDCISFYCYLKNESLAYFFAQLINLRSEISLTVRYYFTLNSKMNLLAFFHVYCWKLHRVINAISKFNQKFQNRIPTVSVQNFYIPWISTIHGIIWIFLKIKNFITKKSYPDSRNTA